MIAIITVVSELIIMSHLMIIINKANQETLSHKQFPQKVPSLKIIEIVIIIMISFFKNTLLVIILTTTRACHQLKTV